MISPSTMQTFSQLIIFIGVILTALGGLGTHFYGKKVDSEKDRLAQQEINQAKDERKEIIEKLKPFEDFANKKYPKDDNALLKLANDFKDLETRTNELEYKIKVPQLSDEQINQISSILKKHKNIEVIIIRENDGSLKPFISSLEKLFEKSGWRIIRNEISLIEPYDGITIFGNGEQNKPVPSHVKDFYLALKNNGVEISKISGDSGMKINTIGLHIGRNK